MAADNHVEAAKLSQLIPGAEDVVFLGAGASASLGFPVMADFMTRLEESIRRSGHDELYKNMEFHETPNMPWPDLELVLTMIAKYREMFDFMENDRLLAGAFGQLAPLRSSVDGLDEIVKNAIFEQYGSVLVPGAVDVYDPLFRLFLGDDLDAFVPVFTTNYDRALEIFCDQSGTALESGFEDSPAAQWDPARFHSFRPDPLSKTIVEFKLHGSVNWYRAPEGIRKISLAQRNLPDHENLVIYPGEMKNSEVGEPFDTMYSYLRACLLRTRRVLVIGYSFRDASLRRIFAEAANQNSKLRIIIMNGEMADERGAEIANQLGLKPTIVTRQLEPKKAQGAPLYVAALLNLVGLKQRSGKS